MGQVQEPDTRRVTVEEVVVAQWVVLVDVGDT